MFTRFSIALALLAGAMIPSTVSAQELDADLAFVHPDAAGFVHVKLAEMWNHEAMAEMRAILAKAGPKALSALDEQFVPKPSTADRVTAVVMLSENGLQDEPGIVAIMRFNEAFDIDAVQKSYLPKGNPVKVGEKTIYADSYKTAIYFPDDKTLVFSDAGTLTRYLSMKPVKTGSLSPALAMTKSHPFVAALNVKALPIPAEALDEIPEVFQPLLKTELAIFTLDMKEQITIAATLTYPNKKAATDGHKSFEQAAQMARGFLREPKRQAEDMLYGTPPEPGKPAQKLPRPIEELPNAVGGLFGIAGINYADEILADLPIKQVDNTLTMGVTLPTWATQYLGMSAMSAGLMLPGVQKVREAAARAKTSNNLKQIAISMHAYHDTYGGFPAAAIVDKKGKPLLSWRVAVLPFIEQGNLYNQFHLDEPWDSEHNLPLSKVVINVYNDPRLPRDDGKTYYKAFVGKNAAIDPIQKRTLTSITDGTSNTLMVASGGEPVVWTKPEDFDFDPNKPLPDLSKPFDNLMCAMCDGSVRLIQLNNIDPKTRERMMKLMIQTNDGQPIPDF